MIIKSEYIRRKLSYIKSIVEDDTKQKLFDINTSAEYIFMHILNDVYGWSLINANEEKPNFPAIDLIDTVNEAVFQVTSEISTKKVRVDTIEKFNELVKQDEYKKYAHYKIKIFYIKNKPNFSDKILEEFESKGVPKYHLYGIEDINIKVSSNPTIATKVFKTLCEIFHDGACASDISPQLTTKLGKSTIIGREKELQEIDEQLKASNTLLIKGIGGVGKSTIGSNYLHRHKDEYDYYGFFEGLESFESELEGIFKLEIVQGQDRLDSILRELIKLDPMSKKLLVIDNVKENKEKLEKILGLEHNGYRVLLTAREEIEDIAQYDLDVLSIDDAKELFNSIYKVKDEFLLEEVLEYLGYHAFFVEMTAKTLKYKKSLTLIKIKKMFESGDFYKVSMKRKEDFNTYLNKLFSFGTLNREEKIILSKLTILPSIEMDFEFLEKVFRVNHIMDSIEIFFYIISYIKMIFFKGTPIDEIFEENLNSLVEKGWLSKTDKGYKLHQITKEYILINYPPNLIETHNIITSVNIQKDNNLKILDEESITNDLLYMESIISFFAKTGNINKNTADYYNALGEIYFKQGLYRKAESSYSRAIEIFETLRKKYPNIAMSYNGLANIYNFNGELDKAKELYIKALEIQKKMLGKVHPEIAKTYTYLANYYKLKNEYKVSEAFYLKALKIQEQTLGEAHIDTTTSYINLAKLYQSCKESASVEQIYVKVLNIRIKEFGQEHLHTAMSYMDLAFFYFDNNDLQKAKKYMMIGIKIFKNILPDNHDYIVKFENVLKEIETKQTMDKQNK